MADTHKIKLGKQTYEVVYSKAYKPKKGSRMKVRLPSHAKDAWFHVKVLKGGTVPEVERVAAPAADEK